jgi:hypothetical protein
MVLSFVRGRLNRRFCCVVACRNPLLGNDHETNSETMPAARQQIFDKQQLNCNRGTVFCTRSVLRCYKQDNWSNESVVGYLSAGKDVSRGHCQDLLPGND